MDETTLDRPPPCGARCVLLACFVVSTSCVGELGFDSESPLHDTEPYSSPDGDGDSDSDTDSDGDSDSDGDEPLDDGLVVEEDTGAGDSSPPPPSPTRVELITFNWPSRYGPTPGVDDVDEVLWGELSAQSSVIALQEAGWIAPYLREQGWSVFRPNPPDDNDNERVGNLLLWDPEVWEELERGWYQLSPRTRIQEEAAGPTWHRPKYVVWARLRNIRDGTEWTFGSVHFVPSKHLGGAALALWERQRDSLLDWWATQDDRTVVMGDFNAQPWDRASLPFWEVAQRQAVDSFGDRRIDWIVRMPALSAAGKEALNNRGQSDHRPVRGIVVWEP